MGVKLSTCIAIFDNEGRILLQHSILRGWELIGGKVDPDECPIKAICREVWEETGMTVIDPVLLGAIDHTGKSNDWCCLCFAGQPATGDGPQLKEPNKVDKFGWFTLADFWELCARKEAWSLAEEVVRKYIAYFRGALDVREDADTDRPELCPA